MSEFSFEFEPSGIPGVGSDDLVCQVCGTPLTYGGRGAKPKYCSEHKSKSTANKTRKTGGNGKVDAAMSVLGFYDGIAATVLMALSPTAAQVWSARIDAATEQKRIILEGNPALAAKIANVGQKGGGFALVGAYAMAGAPAVLVATNEVAQNRAAKKAAKQAASQVAAEVPDNVTPFFR